MKRPLANQQLVSATSPLWHYEFYQLKESDPKQTLVLHTAKAISQHILAKVTQKCRQRDDPVFITTTRI